MLSPKKKIFFSNSNIYYDLKSKICYFFYYKTRKPALERHLSTKNVVENEKSLTTDFYKSRQNAICQSKM